MVAPRVRFLAASIALGLLAAACGTDKGTNPSSTAATRLPALYGDVPAGQVARPDFTLTDTSGHPYDFGTQTQGHVTLLYDGYTHCPDECPTTMADIASALRRLPRVQADQVMVVFVTADPWRDTRRVLRHWLDGFHPPTPYVGLTGTPAKLASVERELGMPVAERRPAPKSYGSGSYAVSHFDGLLEYGRNDQLLTIYPSGTQPAAIAADLRRLTSN